MTQDLSSYLTQYEAEHPGDVLRVRKQISGVQEVTALAQKLEEMDKFPVLIFENVLNPDGRRSPYPLVTNLLASRARCAAAFGSVPRNVARDFARLTRGESIQPAVVSRGEAPSQEIVKTGDRIDLHEFPALVHHYMDPGPYLTAGYFTTQDRDTGIMNSSLHRGWLKDRNHIRIWVAKQKHSWYNIRKNDALNQDTPAAYWIGHHPLACLAAQSKLPYPGSHYEAMSGLMREPLRLVPSLTLGDKFLVPADAEVVIEGFIEANKRYPEGPFGEYMKYFGPQIPNPQMRVTAITHRAKPLWHDLLVGHADNQVMGGFAIESVIYEVVKQRVPSLKNVYLPLSATCRFQCYMQFENPRPGDVRQALSLAMPLDNRVRHIYAFDADVDIFNEREVLWALGTRTQFDRDLLLFPGFVGLDPADIGLITKAGIDCTKPLGEVFYENLRVDHEVYDRVDVSDYFSQQELAQVKTERL